MPEKETLERARRDRERGNAPSTQAGEFVREEMEHIRGGKHGARSTKQAIAIGLSKARRSGVDLPPPRGGKAKTRASAARAYAQGQSGRRRKTSPRRSRASRTALQREGRSAASRSNLARQARQSARTRRTSPGRTRRASPTRSSRTRTSRGRSTGRGRTGRTSRKK